MSSKKQIIEDISNLFGSVINEFMGSACNLKEDLSDKIHDQIESLITKHDLVTREEFEVQKKIIEKLSLKIQELEKK